MAYKASVFHAETSFQRRAYVGWKTDQRPSEEPDDDESFLCQTGDTGNILGLADNSPFYSATDDQSLQVVNIKGFKKRYNFTIEGTREGGCSSIRTVESRTAPSHKRGIGRVFLILLIVIPILVTGWSRLSVKHAWHCYVDILFY